MASDLPPQPTEVVLRQAGDPDTIEKPKRKRSTASKSGSLAVAENDSKGAFFITQHVDRKMVIYPLSEAEMRNLSLLNTIATTLFSVGFAMLTFCAGLFFDLEISTASPVAVREVHVIYFVLIPLGIVCVALAIAAVVWRKSDLGKILAESNPRLPAQ